jgi:hypothetical protein
MSTGIPTGPEFNKRTRDAVIAATAALNPEQRKIADAARDVGFLTADQIHDHAVVEWWQAFSAWSRAPAIYVSPLDPASSIIHLGLGSLTERLMSEGLKALWALLESARRCDVEEKHQALKNHIANWRVRDRTEGQQFTGHLWMIVYTDSLAYLARQARAITRKYFER